MKTNQAQIDFGNTITCKEPFLQFEMIIIDRGSKYSVSGGFVQSQDDIKTFLKNLKKNKKYAKATHNTYAARVSKNGQIWETKSDDGETGAGAVILRILQKQNVTNTIVVVTRWYGGIKLMNDRYKHVQNATLFFINTLQKDR